MSTKVKRQAVRLKVPSLKLAQARLKKLEKLQEFLGKLRWGKNALPAAGDHWDFVATLAGIQRSLVKGIKAKKAKLEDAGISEWNEEDDENGD